MKHFLLLFLAFVALARGDYPTTVLSDSPSGYWRLGEASGTSAADTSGHSLTGTYSSVTLGQTGAISGATSASFNGTSSNVAIGNPSGVQITGQITMEAILKLSALPTSGQTWIICGKGYDGSKTGYFFFAGYSGGTPILEAGCYDGTSNHLVTYNISGWTLNQFYHVAAKFTTSVGWEMLVDGSSVATTSTSVGAQSSAENLYLGAYQNSGTVGSYMSGIMEEVAIYNTALTDTRILAHAVAANLVAPAISVTIPSGGAEADLTFASSASGIVSGDFALNVNGLAIPLSTQTGSGTSWVLPLGSGWITSGQTVSLSYLGSVITPVTVAATNTSAITANQCTYILQGLGVLIDWSYITFGTTDSDLTQAFAPSGFNPSQWMSTAVAAGARYAIFTACMNDSKCLYPSTVYQTPQSTDYLQAFINACNAAGITPGLYFHLWDEVLVPGSPFSSLAMVESKLTELHTRYGNQIKILWFDADIYAVPDSAVPWASLRPFITSLWGSSLIVCNNTHEFNLAHSDIAVSEGGGAGGSPAASSNIIPSEFVIPTRTDNQYYEHPAGASYIASMTVAVQLQQLKAARSSYLLTMTIDATGNVPAAEVTFFTGIGTIMGIQGGPLYPTTGNVLTTSSVFGNRREFSGTARGGINGSEILGIP